MDILWRAQWGATAALGPRMRLPAVGVHLHHSVTIFDDDGDYHATGDVAADMRDIERIGKQRFGRFPYSFCGHPSGWVGEGAGLTIGAHTESWNSTTFGYCLIGNYENDPVTDPQVRAFREWRAWMVAHGWLRPDHWVEPHRTRKATACPGANTMARWHDLTSTTPLEDDMPLNDDDIGRIRTAVRAELDAGTGAGQQGWAATSAAQLATSQAAINLLNEVLAVVRDSDDIDEAEVARAIAPELAPLLDERDAREVWDELGRIIDAAG